MGYVWRGVVCSDSTILHCALGMIDSLRGSLMGPPNPWTGGQLCYVSQGLTCKPIRFLSAPHDGKSTSQLIACNVPVKEPLSGGRSGKVV